MAKTITRQQLIGSRGEAFVNEKANGMGFLYTRYGPLEAGVDGLLEIRDPQTGAVTSQLIAVQVKTQEKGPYTAETDAGFEYLLDANDVAYWRDANLPVIVVLVHLERGVAYWKGANAGSSTDNRRLTINKATDVFDASATDAIAALCVSKGSFGVWFPTLKGGESGHLTLLEVLLPQTMFIAPSPFKTGKEALEVLLESEARPPDDWIIRHSRFMSFRDPQGTVLEDIIDAGAVEELSSAEIAFPEDQAEEYLVIELLRRTLGTQLDGTLAFKRDQKAFYFPAEPKTITRTYVYQSLKQKTSADVVMKKEKDGKLKYVRHHAFEPRFWRLGNKWLLSVTPTFVFTWDGIRPDRFASERLAGKKRLERNNAVLGQFIMWQHLLTTIGGDASGLFANEDERPASLRFKPIDTVSLPRGIPDDIWRASDPIPPSDEHQIRFLV